MKNAFKKMLLKECLEDILKKISLQALLEKNHEKCKKNVKKKHFWKKKLEEIF